jgi:hypothetical protein
MSGPFADTTELATVNCPNGHPIKITLGEARRSQTVRCSRCAATVAINGADVKRKMADIDREWDKLQRTLKNFGR